MCLIERRPRRSYLGATALAGCRAWGANTMACVELLQMDASQRRDDERRHSRRLSDGNRDSRVQACSHDVRRNINKAEKVLFIVGVASSKIVAAAVAHQERALLAALKQALSQAEGLAAL